LTSSVKSWPMPRQQQERIFRVWLLVTQNVSRGGVSSVLINPQSSALPRIMTGQPMVNGA
jgi:hypothetical protein